MNGVQTEAVTFLSQTHELIVFNFIASAFLFHCCRSSSSAVLKVRYKLIISHSTDSMLLLFVCSDLVSRRGKLDISMWAESKFLNSFIRLHLQTQTNSFDFSNNRACGCTLPSLTVPFPDISADIFCWYIIFCLMNGGEVMVWHSRPNTCLAQLSIMMSPPLFINLKLIETKVMIKWTQVRRMTQNEMNWGLMTTTAASHQV